MSIINGFYYRSLQFDRTKPTEVVSRLKPLYRFSAGFSVRFMRQRRAARRSMRQRRPARSLAPVSSRASPLLLLLPRNGEMRPWCSMVIVRAGLWGKSDALGHQV